MDEFGVLTERFGLKPQGKSAPMAGSRLPTNSSPAAQPRTFGSNPKSSYNSSSVNGSSFNGGDDLFGNQKQQNFGGLGGDDLDGIFGDFVKSTKQTNKVGNGSSSFGYDPFFGNSNYSSAKSSFEDDIFGGGISGSSSVNNVGGGVDDIFGSFASSKPKQQDSSPIDDLLGNFGGKSRTPPSRNRSVGFDDDLIPGFGSSGSANKSEPSKSAFMQSDDPFVVLESTSSSTKSNSVDLLDEFTKFTQSGGSKATSSSNVSLPLRPPPKAGQVLKADKVKSSVSSSIDELEDFAMGRAQNNANAHSNVRQTKEVREKQSTKASKYREAEDAARKTQQRSTDDLESFFGMGARSSSVPKSRTINVDPLFDTMTSHQGKSEVDYGKSSSNSSSMRRTSSTTNMVDDFSLIFGDFPSSGEFKEIEGENEERRNARWKRHMRTNDRMERAVAKVKERELQNQQEQEERHRIADQLDVQMTRWAAGKEGNMRALLSSLQYVLWVECGWEPVSLTDLITSGSVKKVYRKAALCLHPDKVLQKGATTEQKYIAEKVFNILKEAWTKFSKEELS